MMMMPSIFSENLFDDFFDNGFAMLPAMNASNALYGKHAHNIMKTDVRETDNSYELDIDLPGFKKDEIKLDLKNGYLTISASKGLDKDERIRMAVISAKSVILVPAAAASMWARA